MADLRRRAVMVATRLGPLRVEFTNKGIAAVQFGRTSFQLVPGGGQAGSLPRGFRKQLQRYAAGQPVKFRCRLDLTGATAFQRRVWRVLRTIPCGQTRSYAWVAARLGQPGAARAVGRACGANPVPILIPCHRVVARNGALGGFSAGRKWKRRLLALERAKKNGLSFSR